MTDRLICIAVNFSCNISALTFTGLRDPVKIKSALKGRLPVNWKTATLESWSTSSGRLILGVPSESTLVLLPCSREISHPIAVCLCHAAGHMQFLRFKLKALSIVQHQGIDLLQNS